MRRIFVTRSVYTIGSVLSSLSSALNNEYASLVDAVAVISGARRVDNLRLQSGLTLSATVCP